MLEKIIKKLDEINADLAGEIIEADNAYDNKWGREILAKQEVLNQLYEFVEKLQREEQN